AGRPDGLLRGAGGSADGLERLLAASGDNAARLEGLLGQTGGDGVQLDELFRVTNGNGWTVSARAGPGPIDNALRHFADHGAEFGARDPLDYVRQAQDFLRNLPGNALTKVRPNGDVVRFDPTTDTFGVMDANGAPTGGSKSSCATCRRRSVRATTSRARGPSPAGGPDFCSWRPPSASSQTCRARSLPLRTG